jgi:hypothetical protein
MTKDEALDKALEALEAWLPTVPSLIEKKKAAITAIKQARSAPVQEPVGVYGHCPICGAKGVTRERRPDGDDRCANGHTYKSMHATTPPAAQPAPVQEPVAKDNSNYRLDPPVAEPVARVIDDGTPEGATEWIPFVSRVEPLKTGDLLYTTPPAAQRQWVALTDIEKLSVCKVGPVYAPDGVVTRTPVQYRKELEGVALMAVRQAEAKLKEKNT